MAAVRACGFTPLHVPMLEIKALDDIKIPDLSAYQGLVFTSANGIEVFAALSPVRDLPVYTVGAGTQKKAFQNGFDYVKLNEGEGGAIGLSSYLQSLLAQGKISADKPLLHPCGVDVKMPVSVPGMTVEQLPIYKAEKMKVLPPEIMDTLDARTIEAILFYSARTAEAFVSLLEKCERTELVSSIKALCISDSVVKSCEDLPWKNVQVAARADGKAMIDLINAL